MVAYKASDILKNKRILKRTVIFVILNEQVVAVWLGIHTTLVLSWRVSIKQSHDKL
jgi:hypothetical protein